MIQGYREIPQRMLLIKHLATISSCWTNLFWNSTTSVRFPQTVLSSFSVKLNAEKLLGSDTLVET